MAYSLGWGITYFCAKFQLLTPNHLRVYKGQTDKQTETQIYMYIYIYIYIDIESPKFRKIFFYIKDLFSIKTQKNI